MNDDLMKEAQLQSQQYQHSISSSAKAATGACDLSKNLFACLEVGCACRFANAPALEAHARICTATKTFNVDIANSPLVVLVVFLV